MYDSSASSVWNLAGDFKTDESRTEPLLLPLRFCSLVFTSVVLVSISVSDLQQAFEYPVSRCSRGANSNGKASRDVADLRLERTSYRQLHG